MNGKEIFKLSDEDLTEVCGGGWKQEKFDEAFSAEAGKQLFLLLAAPIVVGAAVAVGDFVHWAMGKATKKLDQKLDAHKAKPLSMPISATENANA